MKDYNKVLQDALSSLEKAKRDLLKRDSVLEEDRKNLVTSIGKDLVNVLAPLLENISESSKLNKEELKRAISESHIQVDVQNPPPVVHVDAPSVTVPEPKVTVNVPPIKIPRIEFPNGELPIRGWVQLMGVDMSHPLPVQLRDKDGKPINLFDNITQIFSGGGGGFHHVVIDDILAASATVPISTGSTLDVRQVSGANWSVDIAAQSSTFDVRQVSGANWSVDVASQSATFDVKQLSGSVDSVYANNPSGQGDTATALRVVVAGDSAVSVTAGNSLLVDQLSGANWSVFANNPFGQGDQATALRVVIAGDSAVSVTTGATMIVDQLSGANWSVFANNPFGQGDTATALRVVHAGDSALSVSIISESVTLETIQVSGSVDSVQAKPIAMTTNPTTVADGAAVFQKSDKIGRALSRPVQVRELIATAYVALATGTEATLLAGGAAGVFNDLIYVMCANSSDAAVLVDIRDGTAAGIVATVQVPASGTAGFAPKVPVPQNAATNAWTVDMPDITGTTVYVSAEFSKEV